MKDKLITIYANLLMNVGNLFVKISNKLLDKSFDLHMKNNTKVGQKLKEVSKLIAQYIGQEAKTSKSSSSTKFTDEDDDVGSIRFRDGSFYVNRKPKKDN